MFFTKNKVTKVVRFNSDSSNYICVQNSFNKEKWNLITKYYETSETPLIVECNNNHLISISYQQFMLGYGCEICNKSIDVNKFKSLVDKKNWKLFDTFQGPHIKMNFMCDKEHLFQMNYTDFIKDKKCNTCYPSIFNKN